MADAGIQVQGCCWPGPYEGLGLEGGLTSCCLYLHLYHVFIACLEHTHIAWSKCTKDNKHKGFTLVERVNHADPCGMIGRYNRGFCQLAIGSSLVAFISAVSDSAAATGAECGAPFD